MEDHHRQHKPTIFPLRLENLSFIYVSLIQEEANQADHPLEQTHNSPSVDQTLNLLLTCLNLNQQIQHALSVE